MPGVGLVKMYEEGREDEEENIGEGVDKLCNVGREGVVVFTPVNRTGATHGVLPVKERHRLVSLFRHEF